jgi:hypothetical protein
MGGLSLQAKDKFEATPANGELLGKNWVKQTFEQHVISLI